MPRKRQPLGQGTAPAAIPKIRLADRRVAVIDLETDPFDQGLPIRPFLVGFFAPASGFMHWWGADCIEQMFEWLSYYKTPLLIYAHNGGRFDYLFMHKYWNEHPTIVRNRVLKWWWGNHQFRDSWPILPVAQGKLRPKYNLEMWKMAELHRAKYRDEIIARCRSDCEELHQLVEKFQSSYGRGLTLAGIAYKRLDKMYDIRTLRPAEDDALRPYYFGGRVQTLVPRGVYEGDYALYDENSAYGEAMARFNHPIGALYWPRWHERRGHGDKKTGARIEPDTFFVHLACLSTGCFPWRDQHGSVDYPDDGERREYRVTIHEYRMAEKLGLLKEPYVLGTLNNSRFTKFSEYVGVEYQLKLAAERAGDNDARIFHKLMINGAYGKAGFDPRQIRQWVFVPAGKILPRGWTPAWEPYSDADAPMKTQLGAIWFRRLDMEKDWWIKGMFKNVGTAASITGAARALLMYALSRAKGAVYCDTDSIVCAALRLPKSRFGDALGQWKIEATGNRVAAAGKKLYSLYTVDERERITMVGKAKSKGAKLAAEEIIALAGGKVAKIRYRQAAPMFRLHGGQLPLARDIMATAQDRREVAQLMEDEA